MWLWKLVLATAATVVGGWECGVTPEWESALMEQVESARRLQGSTAAPRSSTLGPIRIYAHYGDMSALSPTLVTRIQTILMPSLIAYYANTLTIYQLSQNWSIPYTTCGSQSVPSAHNSPGLPNVDLVLYVSATSDAAQTFVARAGACAFDGGTSKGSPMAGTFEFNAAQYTNLEVEHEIELVRHETAHVLAFAGSLFTRYVQADGTRYTTPVATTTARGHSVSQLTTPKVVQKAKAAFGCSSLTGLEIENGGGTGTTGSHWEKRFMMNDFMVGNLMTNSIYSDITLAAFEDSGWYTVNYDYTNQIVFGKNRGCTFFTTNCVVNGVAQFPEFCDAVNTKMCGNLYTRKATCNISTYTSALPSAYQYFSDPLSGGSDQLADYCPYVQPYSNGDCTGQSLTAPNINASVLGEKSCVNCRCFTGTYIKSGYTLTSGDPNHNGCHEVTCANGVASVLIGTTTVNCPVAGGQVSSISGFDGFINCPAYADICGVGYCLNGCFGYGKCVNGQCQCNDGYSGTDCSTICDLSCKTCTGTGATQCASCYANATLGSGSCTCNSGFTMDSTTKRCNASTACHSTCLTCSGTASNQCLSCISTATLTSGSCPCNAGFVRNTDQSQCVACHPTCLTCSGTTSSQCSTCTSHATPTSGACPCDAGFTRSADSTQCVPCHATCLTCQGTTSSSCTTCKSHASLASTAPTSCACDSGFYMLADSSCAACNSTCKTCSGAAANQCLTCYSGSPNSSNQCLCGAGFFMNGSGSCTACNGNCATCSTSATTCTSCNAAVAVLSGSTCNCLATAFLNSSSGACEPCHVTCASCSNGTSTGCSTCGSSATISSGACVCNSGFTRSADNTACVACHASCLTCQGMTSSSCTTCKSHAALTGVAPTSCSCDSGFYMLADSSCAACHVKCLTCNGPNANQCLSCRPSTATVSSGVCVCNGSNYLASDGTQCVPCNSACLTCGAGSATDCLSCYSQGILTPTGGPGSCSCSDGFYYVPGTGCQRCDITCKQCTGNLSTQCLSCFTGAALNLGSCSCTAGYYLNTSTSSCQVCSPNCKTCDTISTKCTSCESPVSTLSSSNTCQCLSSAFLSTTGACVACDSACVTCSAASNASCLTCAAHATLSSSPGLCQCSPGFYPNPNAKSCAACHASCRNCSGSTSTQCTECITPATLNGTSCQCPSNYFPNPSPASCKLCDSTCKTCSSSTAQGCLSCYAQAELAGTAPSSCKCTTGTVPLPTVANCGVVNCDATCKSCSASGISNCSSCYTNAVGQGSTFPTACVCAAGYYPSPNSANCAACDSSCATCTGPTSFNCLSCPSNYLLVDSLYCSNACPTGQSAVNGACQLPTASLIFRLQLNSPESDIKDTVSQAKATFTTISEPKAYYQQGRLFDGTSSYIQLPPTTTETTRNVVLSATHSMELWVRPTANSPLGCLVTKYTISNLTVKPLIRFCVTDTAQLLLEFTGVSLSDSSSTSVKTVIGGQVGTGREWTSVGYQIVFYGRSETVASIMIGKKSVKTETFTGVFFKDVAGIFTNVQFLLGAGYASYQVLGAFFKGSIAEVSLYNSQFPGVSSACSCSTCSSGGLCLSQCFSGEYQTAAGCATCSSTCTNGCVRGNDCRTNIDPLCATFTTFTTCKGCGDLADMTSANQCQCTANAVASTSQGTCSCSSGYRRSGDKCVQCLSYFSPSDISAYFDDSFLQVILTFSKPVVTSAVSTCDLLFLNTTLVKLGNGYSCNWESNSKTVNVHLGRNSVLVNEILYLNYVNLYSSQGSCSYTAVPLQPVASYKYALPKVIIQILMPESYSVACSNTPTLNLDASGTLGGKGRGMNYTWSIDSDPHLTTLNAYNSYTTTDSTLSIPNALLSTSRLTIKLTVSNYLGVSNTTSKSLALVGSEAISLEIDGGRDITMKPADRRTVRVNPTAICSKTSTMQFTWSFAQSTPSLSNPSFPFLQSPSPPNTLTIPANALKPGYAYTFQVKANDGLHQGSTLFTVTVTPSPLLAVLDRANCDVSASSTFKISGEASTDPDQSEGKLAYLWTCKEGDSLCLDSNGRQVVNGAFDSVLTLQPAQLKVNSTWNITLTVSKGTRSASKSVIINIKSKTAADLTKKDVIPIRVNPQARVSLVFAASTVLKTTFQWVQTWGNLLSVATPLTYPYLIIAANTMQSGATYSFSLTASNSDGTSTASISFTANYPPTSGSASISPTTGVSLFTIFSQSCSSWEDPESDYPLTYYLTYTYRGFEVAVGRRVLSNIRYIKGGPGQYQLTAYVYDALDSYTAVKLPVISISKGKRELQGTSVLEDFQADTIDVEQMYMMVGAYSTAYVFDNATYTGVVSALQSYVSQLPDLDTTDIDSCISSLESLFQQTSQMNSQSLSTLLAFLQDTLTRYVTPLTDSQLEHLTSVLGEYPGKSDQEISQIQAFQGKLMTTKTENALPDQDAAVVSSGNAASYARRISKLTLGGMKAVAGNTTVVFPGDIGGQLSISNDTVLDVLASSQSFPNSTSDEVSISVYSSGRFQSYSYEPSTPSYLPLSNLTSPIQFSIRLNTALKPNTTYVCAYKGDNGEWKTDGVNLTSVSGNEAVCNASHLSTFQVIEALATPGNTNGPTVNPGVVIGNEDTCSPNYAPIGIVSGILLFGLLFSLVLNLIDHKNPELQSFEVQPAENIISTKNFRGLEMLSDKPVQHSHLTESPLNDSNIVSTEPGFGHLFLESHCVSGLFVYRKGLWRWMKVMGVMATLACEMVVVGGRYEREWDAGNDREVGEVWKGYGKEDFWYCLSALAVGLGVDLVLMGVFLLSGKASPTLRKPCLAVSTLIPILLACIATAGSVYISLDLCYEAGGHWAVNFLPLLAGEVLICQTIIAVVRAALTKQLGSTNT